MDAQLIEYYSGRIRASYRFITKGMRPNDEDDCVQECLLSYFKNGKGQTVDQAVIDYLRRLNGRKDSPGYEERKSLNSIKEIDPNCIFEDTTSTVKFDASLVQGRAREVLVLYHEGYILSEIGAKLGVTESRVSQLFSDAIAEYQVMTMVPKKLREWVAENAFKRRNTGSR